MTNGVRARALMGKRIDSWVIRYTNWVIRTFCSASMAYTVTWCARLGLDVTLALRDADGNPRTVVVTYDDETLKVYSEMEVDE